MYVVSVGSGVIFPSVSWGIQDVRGIQHRPRYARTPKQVSDAERSYPSVMVSLPSQIEIIMRRWSAQSEKQLDATGLFSSSARQRDVRNIYLI